MPPKKVNIIIKNEGSLTSLGYGSEKTQRARHSALNKAIKQYGLETVIRKINAIAVLNKNNPHGKVFHDDLEWLESKK